MFSRIIAKIKSLFSRSITIKNDHLILPFSLKTADFRIVIACQVASDLLQNKDFLNEIKNTHSFYGEAVVNKINSKMVSSKFFPVDLLAYKTLNPLSSALAKTQNNKVFINTRKLNRSTSSIASTIIHEFMHILGYSHGDNSPVGKENTVPYKVGSIAYDFLIKN